MRLFAAFGSLLCLCATVTGAPAQPNANDRPQPNASDRPRLQPGADVEITYRTSAGPAQPGAKPFEQRVRWLASGIMRIDPPTPGLYVIIDRAARRMSVVRVADRSVIEMAAPEGAAGMAGGSASDTYIRRGEDMVAGVACTDWETTGRGGQRTWSCITPDGVLLRVRAAGQTLVSATNVRYGPQDLAAFRIPPDYARQKAAAR